MRFLAVLAAACTSSPDDTSRETADTDAPDAVDVSVLVTLDGDPAPGSVVTQPGVEGEAITGDDGRVALVVDLLVSEPWVAASHADARTGGVGVDAGTTEVEIPLVRYDPADNPSYVFRDPGEPDRRETTQQCAHCHVTLNQDWYADPHRFAASNPNVTDLYAGAADAWDASACASAGGTWSEGPVPGTSDTAERCWLGDGVLPALNECDAPCEDTTAFGGCADCHAPGIDGALGGRGLHEATGFAWDFGVHCDVCHRVDDVELDSDPGVAGRLVLTRPSEPSTFGSFDWHPLVFGPFHDVPLPMMGAVQRDHFAGGTVCAGCHEQHQPVLVPGASADGTRWPDGTLPVHTTWTEWSEGPMNPGSPCPTCHMPPAPERGNAADLYNVFELDPGLTTGWERPAGAVKKHRWTGPRNPESQFLQQAASLTVEESVEDGVLTVTTTVTNVGAGHRIPTGEPLRSILLLVEPACDGVPLRPISGDSVPDFGGYRQRKESSQDWGTWSGAAVGDVIRVVRQPGGFYDYPGFGPFGDGTFSAADKGMPLEDAVGWSTVAAVDDGVVTLDAPLPDGDVAYLGDGGELSGGAPVSARAGAAGFGFARVIEASDGRRMVPHFLAVDVASDNRLAPLAAWTTEHRFTSPCADPDTRAVLVHRAAPPWLADERGWDVTESIMEEVWR